MSDMQKNAARESFSDWLAEPEQLGKAPKRLECVDTFELYGLQYYIFRYKKYIMGNWLVGVCGGYEKDALEHCGYVNSKFYKYNSVTAKAHCIEMVEELRAAYKRRVKGEGFVKQEKSVDSVKEAKNAKQPANRQNDKDIIEPDSNNEYEVVERLGVRNYKMKNPGECKTIWQELVPNSGPSEYVQGELLRQMERLRNEAMDNGNINWDDDFVYFCDYVSATLTGSMLFDKEKCKVIRGCMTYIKENGIYAAKVRDGEISQENVDIFKLAYVHDDLYDYMEDVVAEFYMKNKELIPYKKPDNVLR